MSATVAALKFVMGADTAEFERSMKGVEDAMKRAAATGATVGTVIGNALVGAFHSLKESVHKALEAADRMDELSEMIGTSTEKLSALKLAADLNGVSMEALTTNMGKLGKAMTESVSDPASTAARTFAAMGISATDASGKLRPINDVFTDIANKFAGYQDGAAKVTLATNLFGRAGVQMIPILNMGAAGLAQMGDEARRLGLTVETETGKKAAAFNDTMTKLSRVWDGLVIQIAAKLLPTLQQVADWFVKLATDSTSMKLALDGVDVAIKSIITSGIIVKTVFETLSTAIAAVIAALVLLGQLEFRAALDTLKQGAVDFTAEITKAVGAVKDLWAGVEQARQSLAPMADEANRVAAPVVASARSMADAMREMKDEARAALDAIVNAPTESFVAKMDAIGKALAEGTINHRTYGQMVRRVEDENRQNITSTASLVASTLTTVFAKNKAASIAAAIINTAVGITNALAKLPPPFSWAQAALIAASGAAQIATIKSTNSSGTGGSAPSVSGGGGGDGGAAEPAGPSQMLTVNLAPGRYSRDDVMGLIEQINDAVTDGAQLVVNRR